MQSFLSWFSWFSWFTSQTVDWAEAKLPWSQQEHLARQPATLALATAERQHSQPLAGQWTGMTGGVARIFGGKNIFSRTDGEDDTSEI